MVDPSAYYDAFALAYDAGRGVGYHKLIDDQAAELVRRAGEGQRVLEVGCGTGLILGRIARFARRAVGVDLTSGMLTHARRRGLEVVRGDVLDLPFADASFDVVCSFKVLAHVPDLASALREMARVVRPGGSIVFDVYNRRSLRGLIRRLRGPRATSARFAEDAISTRFDAPDEVPAVFPAGVRVVETAGIRVATVHPYTLRLPLVGGALARLEWQLMDSKLARYGGFLVYRLEKA